MNTRKYIKIVIPLFLSVFLLIGCSNNGKSEIDILKDENNQLKQQLHVANEKIKTQNELYDLRNLLDSQTHEILLRLSAGDNSFLKQKATDSISISGKKVLSLNKTKKRSAEFEIPKTTLNLRQRAFMFNDDKKEFHSIYEILPINESNALKTLNVYFVLVDGQWKLDFIGIDE